MLRMGGGSDLLYYDVYFDLICGFYLLYSAVLGFLQLSTETYLDYGYANTNNAIITVHGNLIQEFN